MLGGLVEYENSDGESDAEAEHIADNDAGESADGNKGASSDSDDDALATMAAADDLVEEGLRMRIPASAVTRTPVLPPNPHLAAIVRPPAAAATAAAGSKQPQLKKRRLLLLDPVSVGGDSDDEEDEDAVKRRRVAAAAVDGGDRRLLGATGLLARLPKPKALAVREGGARIFVPPQAAAAAAAAARKKPTPPAPPLPQTQSEFAEQSVPQHSLQLDHEQEQLLGAILPSRELNRYRQATGASLTADNAIRDIRQADQVGDADLRMTKELTKDADADPRRKPAGPMPTSMAKRKHQITFLAFQAQERELELKNSWADARFNQRNTQNKYGF